MIYDRTKIGVSIGNGLAGLANTYAMSEQMKIKGKYRGMSPFYITQVLPNISAGQISIRHQLQGPNVWFFNKKKQTMMFSLSFVIVQLVQLVFKR